MDDRSKARRGKTASPVVLKSEPTIRAVIGVSLAGRLVCNASDVIISKAVALHSTGTMVKNAFDSVEFEEYGLARQLIKFVDRYNVSSYTVQRTLQEKVKAINK